jgi:predicted TIM-barrel fold metal-dependent hydrolase
MLIHGGFPYTEEATYMANVLPNVYFDLSAGTGPAFLEKAVSPERFTDVLRSVPNSKVIYSSDGGEGGPETLWHDCVTAKSAVGYALGNLVDEGIYDEIKAQSIGEDIFYNNSKRLFKF